jgi:hypothetical protein
LPAGWTRTFRRALIPRKLATFDMIHTSPSTFRCLGYWCPLHRGAFSSGARAEILPINDPVANDALERRSFIMRRVFRRLLERADTKALGESIWIHVRQRKRIETFMLGVPSTAIFHDEKKAMLHFDVPQ